jgi:hypothetical protein
MDVKPVLSNAIAPIETTPLPIVMELRLVQFANADIPITVTLFGIVIDVKLVQP